jgi:hypothetical protein
VISHFPSQNYLYKILKINDNTTESQFSAISTNHQEYLNELFSNLVEDNKPSYEVLEISIEEIETRFKEISDFFSSLKNI